MLLPIFKMSITSIIQIILASVPRKYHFKLHVGRWEWKENNDSVHVSLFYSLPFGKMHGQIYTYLNICNISLLFSLLYIMRSMKTFFFSLFFFFHKYFSWKRLYVYAYNAE